MSEDIAALVKTGTFKLVLADETAPIVGELRFVRKWIPMPGEELASMDMIWLPIVWDGVQWRG